MESFKSRQFAPPQANPAKQPMKLNSHSRKLYPELASMLDLEVKQERLRKLQKSNDAKNNSRPPYGLDA